MKSRAKMVVVTATEGAPSMGKSITDLSSVTTVGLDLAKHVFQVHGVDASGRVVVAKAIRRNKLLEFFASLPPCLVGLEACGSAHHWARELIKLGHDARMMPPAYVKPYIRRQKNDASDAAAICEAVTRPSMRFVGVRSLENQATLMRHKTREMLVSQRTQLLNALRGHLTEVGVIAAQGPRHGRELAELIEACDETIPFEVCEALAPLVVQLRNLDEAIARLDRTIAKMAQKDETARRLMSIPGFGPITRLSDGGDRSGCVRLRGPARVRRLSRADAQAELFWRQAEARAHFEDGQPELAQTARRRGACGAVSPQAAHRPAADVGEEASREEALQACRRGSRQQDGAHRICDHAGQDGLSGNSGVTSAGWVRGRSSPKAKAAQESRVTKG
jgi:transposase